MISLTILLCDCAHFDHPNLDTIKANLHSNNVAAYASFPSPLTRICYLIATCAHSIHLNRLTIWALQVII